jgi:hypothetical protein
MPPKRGAVERAEDNVPPKAPAASTPEQAESIDERHARLTLAVRSQRMLVEIEEVERELREGSTPASGARGAGTSPAGLVRSGLEGQCHHLCFDVYPFVSYKTSNKVVKFLRHDRRAINAQANRPWCVLPEGPALKGKV